MKIATGSTLHNTNECCHSFGIRYRAQKLEIPTLQKMNPAQKKKHSMLDLKRRVILCCMPILLAGISNAPTGTGERDAIPELGWRIEGWHPVLQETQGPGIPVRKRGLSG